MWEVSQVAVTKKRGQALFQWLTIDDIIKLDGMEQYLVQYMGNVTDTFVKQCVDWHFSIATDKGQVNSLKLQDSIIALPNNQAWLCAPVVPCAVSKGARSGTPARFPERGWSPPKQPNGQVQCIKIRSWGNGTLCIVLAPAEGNFRVNSWAPSPARHKRAC